MAVPRQRLDEVLVERGLARSRSEARGLIMAGLVLSEDRVLDKAGTPVAPDIDLRLKERPRFVSRAGEKLAGALSGFDLRVVGKSALDVGASTGGFVDCLLQEGVAKVIALDVGKGQLDSRLRDDPRVTVMDGVNARWLTRDQLPYEPDLLTMDVSFISVRKVLPAVLACMAKQFEGVILVKPQFEAGPKSVGKKGIVRDPAVHQSVLGEVLSFLIEDQGLQVRGLRPSAIRGTGGNIEFLVHLTRGGTSGLSLDTVEEVVREVVALSGSGSESV